MNVLIIQPPHAAPFAEPVEPTPEDCRAFAPPWDLMCLKAYLAERTRHTGHFLDCRLYSSHEHELVEAIAAIPGPRLALVYTESTHLGQAAATLEVVTRHFPGTPTVVCGPHPSQFPEEALLPRADFALSGDPEPILRGLLDALGRPRQLLRVPGLLFDEQDNREPYWLSTLKGLSFPEWESFFWRSYIQASPARICRASVRLSRGHTLQATDRAEGGWGEPLRTWPMDRLAQSLQRCAVPGISEVFVADPPGFWTVQRLRAWCAALLRVRNMQVWSLQLLPAVANDEIIGMLYDARCTRVQFVVPSCDPEVLNRYGCNVSADDLAETVNDLLSCGIRSHVRFWLGGPEEQVGEEARVLKFLRTLGYGSFSLAPFPYRLDAPLYEETAETAEAPSLDDWMEWAWDPWNRQQPLPFWNGADAAERTRRIMTRIRYKARRSPRRLILRAGQHFLGRNWIRVLEDKASGLVPHPRRRET